MQILLRKVKIVDPSSKHHGKTVDLLVKKGKIEKIGKNIPSSGVRSVEVTGACLSPGWLDIGTQVGDPGYEHREDLESVSRAALAGGYSALAPFPNTDPVMDSASMIAYWKNRSTTLPIHIHPIGAVSKECKGVDLAELQDMHEAGAVAFSDGQQPIDNEGLLLRALNYALRFDGLVIDQPLNQNLVPEAQVHEGKASAMMGIKGQPVKSEVARLKRNLDIVEYTGGRLCCHLISTNEGVKELKKIKKKGSAISSSVGIFNLCMTDEDVLSFDHNLKLVPPLRSKSDQKSLIKALKKGTIQIICSQHIPLEEERKEMAFFDADPGCLGLQTVFPLLATYLNDDIDIETMVKCLCHNPRHLLGLGIPSIESGHVFEATMFHPDHEWTFDKIHSKSKNTSLLNKSFSGCVIGTFVKDKVHWNIDI
ncbi:MAG: dihydroorotase [Saprospiraceae bacterium]|nr:dihydroorotase [Saprospiraceae bacterium]